MLLSLSCVLYTQRCHSLSFYCPFLIAPLFFSNVYSSCSVENSFQKSIPGSYLQTILVIWATRNLWFLWTLSYHKHEIYCMTFLQGFENMVLSNGGIVVLTYSTIGQETINKLTQQMVYLLTKVIYLFFIWFDLIWFIVFNATFSNISAISWRPVLVVEEARVHGENHWPWASNW